MPSPEPIQPPAEFLQGADALGIVFDPGDVERLGRFLELLLEANTRFNLTGITDPGEAWTKHILDSLTLVPLLAELGEAEGAKGPARVIDIGSGGGVPGIPLAVVLPGVRFTLVEATAKKAEFLREAAAALGLANVEVLNDRAERLGQDRGERGEGGEGGVRRRGGHRERYDAATARALGHLAIVAELAIPLLKVRGVCLAVKGARAEQEIGEAGKALELLSAHHEGTVPTPTGRIVVLRKDARTARTYPRRDGEPKRSPLGVRKN